MKKLKKMSFHVRKEFILAILGVLFASYALIFGTLFVEISNLKIDEHHKSINKKRDLNSQYQVAKLLSQSKKNAADSLLTFIISSEDSEHYDWAIGLVESHYKEALNYANVDQSNKAAIEAVLTKDAIVKSDLLEIRADFEIQFDHMMENLVFKTQSNEESIAQHQLKIADEVVNR
ncbi:MAG: hypothetical protein F4Z66_04110, partial [Gammaproteobacteria bacterium]|nr:hypothetical protein [Gammaproteobacteria bacterium]